MHGPGLDDDGEFTNETDGSATIKQCWNHLLGFVCKSPDEGLASGRRLNVSAK
jgi:hypothetical protein